MDCGNQYVYGVSDMRVSAIVALFIWDETLTCDLSNFDRHRLRGDRVDKEPVVYLVVVAFGSDNIISRRDRRLTRLRHWCHCKAAIGVMDLAQNEVLHDMFRCARATVCDSLRKSSHEQRLFSPNPSESPQ